MKRLVLSLFIIASFSISCGESAEELLDSGWANFEAGDYAQAINDFEDAISENSSLTEAYSGIGWSQLRLDRIDDAENNFQTALDRNYAGKEVLAGLAAISLAKEEYMAAIGYAESILNIDPDWVFVHDSSVDYRDVWLLVAIANFHEGNFAEVESAIKNFDNSFSISENSPSTWVVGTVSYDSYEEAIAAYLLSISSELNI